MLTIPHIQNDDEFITAALSVFRYQYENNKVYHRFCNLLHRSPHNVHTLEDIPFLPIHFFKTEKVYCGDTPHQEIFTSSGTTGVQTSQHYVKDLSIYQESFRKGFQHFYGDVRNYTILALLPSYLERQGSSLITMTDDLIRQSQSEESGFYLHNYAQLAATLQRLDKAGGQVLLIGVSFALLSLVEQYTFQLKNTIVMETGGMKGKRKELIREELHQLLKEGFGVPHIHSEYGMTELLSQAYSSGEGIYRSVPWMKILIRDTNDALSYLPTGKTGGVNVIDLANIHSCSFISTQDLGKLHPDGSFEILGRFDNTDLRGCNLMVSL